MRAIDLDPAPFPQSNTVLTAPPDMDNCGDLHVFGDGYNIVSSWALPWRARLAVVLGARVWLHVLGAHTHPPISITVSRGGPFEPTDEGGQP